MAQTPTATTALNFTPDSVAFVQTLLDTGFDSGAIDGDSRKGNLKIDSSIRNVVYALYHALSGAQAVCSVNDASTVSPGNSYTLTMSIANSGIKASFDNLKQMEADCTKAINDANSSFSENYKLVMEF